MRSAIRAALCKKNISGYIRVTDVWVVLIVQGFLQKMTKIKLGRCHLFGLVYD